MINRITDNKFKLVSKYQPSGDQPQAIEQLVDNIEGGEKAQILMGATGTGKTYTMSQVISKVNKPTLVIAHNKTLAGQLYGEFKEFLPEMAFGETFFGSITRPVSGAINSSFGAFLENSNLGVLGALVSPRPESERSFLYFSLCSIVSRI